MTMKVGWTIIASMRPFNAGGGGNGLFGLMNSGTNYAQVIRNGTSGTSAQAIRVNSLGIDNTVKNGTSNDIPTNTDCVIRLTIGDGVMTTHRNGSLLITGENDFDGSDTLASCL